MSYILRGYLEWYKGRNHLPGDEDLHKLSQPDKAIGKETQATDQGECHNDPVRLHATPSRTEPGTDPLGPCCCIGAPQPDGEKHHQEDLVENRPEPWDPDGFQAVYKGQGYQPHRTRNIEHSRCIAQSKHVPWQLVPTQHIGCFILLCAFFHDQTDDNGRGQVSGNNQNVEQCEFHRRNVRMLGCQDVRVLVV